MSQTNAWEDNKSSQKGSKTLIPDTSSLIVRIIEDDIDNLSETLGITKEDNIRLQEKLRELLVLEDKKEQGKKSLGQVLVDLSKECTHANQLAFVCFALGRTTSDKNTGKLSGLLQLIEAGKKPGGVELLGGDSEDPVTKILKDIFLRMKRERGEE